MYKTIGLFSSLLLTALFSTTVNSTQVNNNQIKAASDLVINEYQADPHSTNGDANGDGTSSTSQDEFVEIYNNSPDSINISGWILSDGFKDRHTFPANTIVPGNCSIVIFSGGNPSGAFGFSIVQTASTGALGLNNSGDDITLKSGATQVLTLTTQGSSSTNQSYTRDPDVTGLFIPHSDASTSGGTLFSPGTNADGSNFSGCPVGDLPPFVSTTIPANSVSEVATDATITIDFSENVTTTINAFTLSCDGQSITLPSPPATGAQVVLTPAGNMPIGAFCTVTAVAAEITDDAGKQLDGNKDTVEGDDFNWTFIIGLPELEIYEIQGNSVASAYDGYKVSTLGNVVTARIITSNNRNGFFMQTPDARDDNDANTSNGVYSYVGNNPLPEVGDIIDVTGNVVEYFEFTEFSFPTWTLVSSGGTLPTPLLLDDNFPPNDPATPICSTDPDTARYECLEGMSFNMPQGFVSAGFSGNSFFPGANGEDVLVRAGTHRAFREPGIDYPGDATLPNSPIFDGNPELLEMDIDSLTLPLTTYAGGTELAIKGVFGYDFGEYEIWPSEITVINENVIPGAVRAANSTEVTIGSANLFRFFDNVDDVYPQDDDTILTTQEFNDKVSKLSKYFVNDLKAPMILALQEVENLNSLNVLAAKIQADFSITYTPYLIDGPDPGGINVAYMLRDNVTPDAGFPKQLGTSETQSTNGFTLHDRPPFHLQAQVVLAQGTIQVQVLGVHNRSRGKIEDNNPLEAQRVRVKRMEQANSIAAMIDVIQTANPDDPIITLGDFNAFNFTDGYADVIGQITGTAVEIENEYWTAPIFAASPLTQAIQTLPTDQQYSFVFQGTAQVLDNALLNDAALTLMNEIQFARGQSDANITFKDDPNISLRVSDHDGFVLYLTKDFDLIFQNGFE